MRTRLNYQQDCRRRMVAENIAPEKYGRQYAVETPQVSYQGYDWSYVVDDQAIFEKIEADRKHREMLRQQTQERMRRRTLSYKIRHFFGLE